MQTKLIEIQAKTATVYFFGDIHEGAANHQAKALKEAIDIIATDSDAYWIGMGDYIDAGTKGKSSNLELAGCNSRCIGWECCIFGYIFVCYKIVHGQYPLFLL